MNSESQNNIYFSDNVCDDERFGFIVYIVYECQFPLKWPLATNIV